MCRSNREIKRIKLSNQKKKKKKLRWFNKYGV